jgi:hypothetical protein
MSVCGCMHAHVYILMCVLLEMANSSFVVCRYLSCLYYYSVLCNTVAIRGTIFSEFRIAIVIKSCLVNMGRVSTIKLP